jgi:hypothetical protein
VETLNAEMKDEVDADADARSLYLLPVAIGFRQDVFGYAFLDTYAAIY